MKFDKLLMTGIDKEVITLKLGIQLQHEIYTYTKIKFPQALVKTKPESALQMEWK